MKAPPLQKKINGFVFSYINFPNFTVNLNHTIMKKIYVTLAAMALCLTACKKEVKVENDTTVEGDTITVDTATTAEVEKPRDSVAEMKAWEAYMTPVMPTK